MVAPEKTTCARQKQVIYPWISIEKGGVPCNRSRLPLSRIVGRIAHSKFYRLLLPFAVLLRQSEHKVKWIEVNLTTEHYL
jgi:hypothetical protein